METISFFACDYCYAFVKKGSFEASVDKKATSELPHGWEKTNGIKTRLFCPECVKASKLNAIIKHEMFG